MRTWLLAFLLLTSAWPIHAQQIALSKLADGFSKPLFLSAAHDATQQLYVVEQGGRIYAMDKRGRQRHLFLDVSPWITTAGFEQGLLGLAFHRHYRDNGRLFVYYTRRADGAVVVAEFHRGADGRADPASQRIVLVIPEPASNHNGGMLAFGPDGYLYLGPGDGGKGGDPWGNAQNPGVLLGKLLRIDVDHGRPYAIPPDNPLVGQSAARPEIWVLGLRNPWRFSFDRRTGALWIADVGQNRWEEIDFQPPAIGGRNYGWNRMEGNHCYPPGRTCQQQGLTLPVAEYPHTLGCSITGGYVLRSPALPTLAGVYVFADYCSGRIWGLWPQGQGAERMRLLLKTDLRITSFGEDTQGNVYVVDQRGGIYRIIAGTHRKR